jgi:hypothetical protein
MFKWPVRGHFLYLRFKTFPMTPRSPQCEVFWALLSNSEHSGVPEDSKILTFSKCWASPPHLAKVGLRHQLCTNHFVLVLCRSVWIIEACHFFLVPSRSPSPPLYPSIVLWAREPALIHYSFVIFSLGLPFESLKELGVCSLQIMVYIPSLKSKVDI